ncbi:unnamed protein product [Dibothriocephalus latus]|uniref:Uncharacterized protein n=1 Tax=Dibothriocephalus latus TaxID=60516 RepID=A0A3P7LKK4_DIBLA|nr:unnamed protein product [Dibothriocephalus latus]
MDRLVSIVATWSYHGSALMQLRKAGTAKTGAKKRPASPPAAATKERVNKIEAAEVSARAAKRLSAFAFSDNA